MQLCSLCGCSRKFYQIFKELRLILPKLFQMTEKSVEFFPSHVLPNTKTRQCKKGKKKPNILHDHKYNQFSCVRLFATP